MNYIVLAVFAALMVFRYRAMMKCQGESYPPYFYGLSAAVIVIGFYWVLDIWSRGYIVLAMLIAAITVIDLIGVVFIMLIERNIATKRRN